MQYFIQVIIPFRLTLNGFKKTFAKIYMNAHFFHLCFLQFLFSFRRLFDSLSYPRIIVLLRFYFNVLFGEILVIKWGKNFNKVILCNIRIRRVCNTILVKSARFVFDFFHGNIRKIVPKYVAFLCLFYIIVIVG